MEAKLLNSTQTCLAIYASLASPRFDYFMLLLLYSFSKRGFEGHLTFVIFVLVDFSWGVHLLSAGSNFPQLDVHGC